MADSRTMAQMLQAPIEGYEDAIVIPPINANNFELKQRLVLPTLNPTQMTLDLCQPSTFVDPEWDFSSPMKTRDSTFEEFTDEFTLPNSLPPGDDVSILKKDFQEETFQITSNSLFEFNDSFKSSNVNPLFEENDKDVEIKFFFAAPYFTTRRTFDSTGERSYHPYPFLKFQVQSYFPNLTEETGLCMETPDCFSR
ncbi:hypothetical protein Tco_0134672 [Tanacetum coccineum]